jgi:excisionase family DNA binding protein
VTPPRLHSSSQSVSVIPNGGERGQLWTAEQVAERWQISAAQVYRLARDGEIPCVTLGRYRRFRLASIEAFELAREASSDA